MPSEKGFLRQLPVGVDDTQAVHFEALLFAMDTLASSLGAIRRISTAHREHVMEAGRVVRTELFTHAWRIVDCVHVILQVLRALDYASPLSLDFQKRYERVRVLRNRMDHLTANAKNNAGAKGRPPIFGALSYMCIPDENIVVGADRTQVSGGGIVTLSSGRLSSGQSIKILNPMGRRIDGLVGGFQIDALGETVVLEDAVRDLEPVVDELEAYFAHQFLEQAKVLALEQGVSLESLTGHPGSGAAVYMKIAFSEPVDLVEVPTPE